jgi:hypothetical protein
MLHGIGVKVYWEPSLSKGQVLVIFPKLRGIGGALPHTAIRPGAVQTLGLRDLTYSVQGASEKPGILHSFFATTPIGVFDLMGVNGRIPTFCWDG